ncbi:hypothetical protein VIN01S_22280 [Vibrio inusitatus NBRC 102082]|uniref:MotA/TolQ/ExbB proton channel domain-containing protein n=1 Tax=Vibrio inusitatus NBRC 102082 TaxID=1219070 RepID=A0A4Y3HYU9_9VIBR|nr:methyl-accepting chemotaxis protein [Vibrio inusitatus]GEA51424.1 hypothetical protein VIN01S_22280 [Vibrio inusitatus NBRC 102082]
MSSIFQDPLTIIFSALIIIGALITAFKLHGATGKLIKQLNQVNSELGKLKHQVDYDDDGNEVEQDWTSNSASIAYQNYDKMHSLIQKVKYLAPSWGAYRRSMQLPDTHYTRKQGQAPALRNTLQVNSVFNMETVVEPHVNVRQYTAIPNMLTGAGLLFTFVGLMIGIGEASVGLSSSDIESAKASLNPLLSGASIAFTTSVVGIICSMIFSWYEKSRFHKLEVTVKDFSDYLASHIEMIDSDKLAAMQLEATEAQTKALADFQVDQQRITDDTIRRVSREFRESLLESAGTEIKQMGVVLQEMNTGLLSNIDRFSEAQDKTLETTSKLTSNLESSVQSLTQQLATSVDEMSSREKEVITHVESVVSAMTDTVQAKVVEVSENYTTTMRQTSAEFANIPQQLAQLTSDHMSSSLQQYQTLTSEMLPQMLQQVAESLGEQVSNLAQQMRTAESAVADSIAQLPNVVDSFKKMNTELVGNVQVVNQLNSSSMNCLEGFNQVITNLDSASHQFVEANQQTSSTLQQFQHLIEQVQVSAVESGESNKAISKATEQLNSLVASQAGFAAQFEVSLNQSFEVLNQGLEQYVTHANNQLLNMDSQSADVANNLMEAANEIGALVNDLSSTEYKKAAQA